MNIETLAEKHAKDFTGYQLVDFYEAAFPSYVLNLKVLMQIEHQIPVLQEFIMRSVDAGQATLADIGGLLGLEWQVVENGLDELQRRNYILFQGASVKGKETTVSLTNKGKTALKDLFFKEPEPTNQTVCLDALTGKLYPYMPLRQPQDIRKMDYHEIPTYISTPDITRIDFSELKRLVRQEQANLQEDRNTRTERRELIDLLDLEKYWTAYRVMRVLQYVRPEDGSIQVQVYDRGDRSREHEAVLLIMEAKKYRPLRAMPQKQVPPCDTNEMAILKPEAIKAARVKAVEAPRIQEELNNKQQILDQVKSQQSSRLVEERVEANFQYQQSEVQTKERTFG